MPTLAVTIITKNAARTFGRIARSMALPQRSSGR